jgi:L-threonylcarbamoyladenylate synthase
MKIIRINPQNPEKDKINQALDILEKDGIIVYPTDTIYGLGANIYSEKAIIKVFSIKKRDHSKPLSICISKIGDISKIAYLGEDEKLINKNLPGPYTIILKKKEHVSPLLTADSERIGIRIPDYKICRELTRKFPITSTSANISGEKVPVTAEEVAEQLGDQVDLVIDGGKIRGTPSTVVDCTKNPPEIIRKSNQEFKL